MNDVEYYQAVRDDLIQYVQGTNLRVLELGCGTGATLRYLKQKEIASYVIGVDIQTLPEKGQEELDEFVVGDVETLAFPWAAGSLDLILCGDVLEHLRDPLRIVARLADLLKPGAQLIFSVPNFRHYQNLWNIFVRGDFKYTDAGLLDHTHIHFFCRRNILEMIQQSGLELHKLETSLALENGYKWWLNRLTFGFFEEFLVYQYHACLEKPK